MEIRHQRRWTACEIARAQRLHEEGLPPNDIAFELGRTFRSIKSILYSRRKGPPEPPRSFYDGPAIGYCPIQARLNRNAIAASAMLLHAIELAGVRP